MHYLVTRRIADAHRRNGRWGLGLVGVIRRLNHIGSVLAQLYSEYNRLDRLPYPHTLREEYKADLAWGAIEEIQSTMS